MILQTVASLTTALTLITASVPRGESPTFQNDPDVSYASVVQNFRQANQLLLVVEEGAAGIDPEKAARVEPVLAVLEEQLGETAHQLSVAGDLEQSGVARVSVGSARLDGEHASSVDRVVYEGINADIQSVTNDLKNLAAAMGTSDYL